MPDIPGEFAGEYRHSSTYWGIDELRGKRVLIIGAGNLGQTYARYAEHAPDQLWVGGVAEPRGPQREGLARRYGLAAGYVFDD